MGNSADKFGEVPKGVRELNPDDMQYYSLETEVATFRVTNFYWMEGLLGVAPGVVETRVGYNGEACGSNRDMVQIEFIPGPNAFKKILYDFWDGVPEKIGSNDVIIYYHDGMQKQIAEESKAEQIQDTIELRESAPKVQIKKAPRFKEAEGKHQKFYLRKAKKIRRKLKITDDALMYSRLACRLNGYLGGFGTRRQFEKELATFNLSPEVANMIRNRIDMPTNSIERPTHDDTEESSRRAVGKELMPKVESFGASGIGTSKVNSEVSAKVGQDSSLVDSDLVPSGTSMPKDALEFEGSDPNPNSDEDPTSFEELGGSSSGEEEEEEYVEASSKKSEKDIDPNDPYWCYPNSDPYWCRKKGVKGSESESEAAKKAPSSKGFQDNSDKASQTGSQRSATRSENKSQSDSSAHVKGALSESYLQKCQSSSGRPSSHTKSAKKVNSSPECQEICLDDDCEYEILIQGAKVTFVTQQNDDEEEECCNETSESVNVRYC